MADRQYLDVEGNFRKSHERAAIIPSTSSCYPGANSVDAYNNAHHSQIRRSSDDREKDLLLEEQSGREAQLLDFDEAWFSVSRGAHMDQRESSRGRNDLPSSSGTIADHDDFEKSMTCSSKKSMSSPFFPYSRNSIFSNSSGGCLEQSLSSAEQDGVTGSSAFSNDELVLELADAVAATPRQETDDTLRDSVVSGIAVDEKLGCLDTNGFPAGSGVASSSALSPHELVLEIADAVKRESRGCTTATQQEADSTVSGITKDNKLGLVDRNDFPSDTSPNEDLYDICLFKRRIIARDKLEHGLHITPVNKYLEIFPKIKRDEALVYHGTEFPMGEQDKPMRQCSLHRRLLIVDSLHVKFEMVLGEVFVIEEPSTRTVTVDEIISKGNERITAGFSINVLIKCFGNRDKLYEDSVRVTLRSGDRTVRLIFPVAYYEASITPWPKDCSVTAMPQDDRDALLCCWIELLEKIGDVMSLCDQLYQYKIFDDADMDEVMDIKNKRERNAHVLRTIQRRGNILDFVIKVLQAKRENQGAAVILQKMRHHEAM